MTQVQGFILKGSALGHLYPPSRLTQLSRHMAMPKERQLRGETGRGAGAKQRRKLAAHKQHSQKNKHQLKQARVDSVSRVRGARWPLAHVSQHEPTIPAPARVRGVS